MLVGYLLGTVACAFAAPPLVRWWFESPVPGKLFNCEADVGWAMSRLVTIAAWSALAGIVLSTVAGLLGGRYLKQRAELKAAAAAALPKAAKGD
jgi:hypothetical protein